MPTNMKAVKIAYGMLLSFFLLFLFLPLIHLFYSSVKFQGRLSLSHYGLVLQDTRFWTALGNSFSVSLSSAAIATVLALLLVKTLRETPMNSILKGFVRTIITLPMLLPTLTYGFVILYAFGKQGLITTLVGKELFSFYGFNGLLLGYVIYTLPPAFLLLDNAAGYLDGRYVVVSRLMGDHWLRTLWQTWLCPMAGALGGAFVLAFILAFTDYGIPAAIGGAYPVLATRLYDVMLGSIPNIEKGSVVAILLLMPAFIGFAILNYLERFRFHSDRINPAEPTRCLLRDGLLGTFAIGLSLTILSIFSVMFIVPFVKDYPYNMDFTWEIAWHALSANNLSDAYVHSFIVALFTAILGTIMTFSAALANTRSPLPKKGKQLIDAIAMLCNTLPGMVIGISYLLAFNKTDLKGTLGILIISNMVHFFTTPYLMAKNALEKMNPAWNTTAALLGDTWLKTLIRITLPNAKQTLIEMLSYYFINSMVTISAVIFLVSSKTMLITTKIKEFQYFSRFSDVFILSLLILITNLMVKVLTHTGQHPHRLGLITLGGKDLLIKTNLPLNPKESKSC